MSLVIAVVPCVRYDVPCCYKLPYVCGVVEAAANNIAQVFPDAECKYRTAAHYQCDEGDGNSEALAFILSMSMSGCIFTLSLVGCFCCLAIVTDEE